MRLNKFKLTYSSIELQNCILCIRTHTFKCKRGLGDHKPFNSMVEALLAPHTYVFKSIILGKNSVFFVMTLLKYISNKAVQKSINYFSVVKMEFHSDHIHT